MSWLLAILALGLLIIVHEGGHYLVARLSRMRVERFSLGFGPALLKWKSGDTQFQLAPLPLGGFVQITGMNPHEDYDEKDPYVYPNRPTWQRFLTIFAGPAMNYVFAMVLILMVFVVAGIETGTSWHKVSAVDPTRPAFGKLQKGDRILALSGNPIYEYLDGEAQTGFAAEVQKRGGESVRVTVLRDGATVEVEVKPVWDRPRPEMNEAWVLGITLGSESERRQVGVVRAAYHAARYPWALSGQILAGLYKVATRQLPADFQGPVKITEAIKDHFEVGWIKALAFLALLNVYLGLVNLLPIPALDGGRLVFLGYELATRRRPNPKVEAAVHMVGFLALMAVLVFVTFDEIREKIQSLLT